ncbi:hypothetical protein MCOR23_011469, partial [Pyricularia oryzae]
TQGCLEAKISGTPTFSLGSRIMLPSRTAKKVWVPTITKSLLPAFPTTQAPCSTHAMLYIIYAVLRSNHCRKICGRPWSVVAGVQGQLPNPCWGPTRNPLRNRMRRLAISPAY